MTIARYDVNKLPPKLSDYWLVKDLKTDETAGIMRYSRPPGIIESETGVWLLQISVRGIENPIYVVKVRSEDECVGWVDRYYLETITESEGKTYVAMKMNFFDAG